MADHAHFDLPEPPSAVGGLPADAVYVEEGGIRYGLSYWAAVYATAPLVKLTATRDSITLQSWFPLFWPGGRTICLPRESVRLVSRKRALLGAGAVFQHEVKQYAPLIVFWTWNYERLAHALTGLGYRVG